MIETRITVVVPAFNEEATIGRILSRVRRALGDLPAEIIALDDGSTDGTLALLRRVAREDDRVRVVSHPVNRGKGAAMRSAIAIATGDILLVQDADLEYDPADYPALLAPVLRGEADVVYGNRFHAGRAPQVGVIFYLGNRVLTLLTRLLTGLAISDMEVGYKVFRTDMIRRLTLTSDRFGFEPEVTVKMARLGCRLVQVPIHYHPRTRKEGKKIKWTDGIAAVAQLVRARFFDSNDRAAGALAITPAPDVGDRASDDHP